MIENLSKEAGKITASFQDGYPLILVVLGIFLLRMAPYILFMFTRSLTAPRGPAYVLPQGSGFRGGYMTPSVYQRSGPLSVLMLVSAAAAAAVLFAPRVVETRVPGWNTGIGIALLSVAMLALAGSFLRSFRHVIGVVFWGCVCLSLSKSLGAPGTAMGTLGIPTAALGTLVPAAPPPPVGNLFPDPGKKRSNGEWHLVTYPTYSEYEEGNSRVRFARF